MTSLNPLEYIAVANRKSEKNKNEIQQAIAGLNVDFLSVRNRMELIEVIRKRFAELLQFDDVIISIADAHRRTHQNFIHYTIPGLEQNKTFFKISEANYDFDDGFYDITLKSVQPLTWDLAELATHEKVPSYLRNIAQNGVRKILAVGLASVNGKLGCLFFLSRNPDAFAGEEPAVALAIGQLLPGILYNILYAEAAERRNDDKEQLFEVLADIATVRDSADLDKLVTGKLKSIFQFNDFIIPILNQDYLTHKVCLSYTERVYKISGIHAVQTEVAECRSDDGILDMVMEANYPKVWDIDKVMQWDSIPSYVQVWHERHMKRMAGIPVRSKGESIGAILFASLSAKSFDESELFKINTLKNQLAAAAVNVLANEDLKNRENEKEMLLALSNDIAAIRNKDQLLSIIRTKLKPLLHFNDFVISILSQDRIFHQAFVYDIEEKRRNHPDFKRLVESNHPADDGIINLAVQANHPASFVIEELLKTGNAPEYVSFYHDTGVKEIVGIAMRNGREDVGALFLAMEQTNAFSKQQMALIKSITSQLCIVISNIIANELIAEREKEVTYLLELSNEIAAVRDRSKLQSVLKEKIRNFFPYAEIGIVLFDEASQSYYNFTGPGVNQVPVPILSKMPVLPFALGKFLIESVQQRKVPVVYDLQEMHREGLLNIEQFGNEQQLIGVGIKNGAQVIGSLVLQQSGTYPFPEKHYTLLQRIADQLFFTVFNILANERVLKRENEQTFLLEISKGIAKVRSKTDLQKIVQEKLSGKVQFNYALIVKLNDEHDSGHVFVEFLPEQANRKDTASSYEIFPISGGLFDHVLQEGKATIFAPGEWIEMTGGENFTNKGLLKSADKGVAIPFYENKQASGIFIIFSGQAERFTANQINFLQDFSAQLSIATANVIANDKIERQILEISGFKQQLEVENLYLQEEIYTTHNYSELIGMSAAIHEVFRLTSQVSQTQSSVLLLGETGTGKELIARAIHNNSLRKNKVMVKVNCATLPANLIESELFGHERGSFTGATDRRIGKFELANNSTIFLDEIGEMPLDLQAKLLRALQEKEIERVGGRSVIKTDVRVIAATNRDLAKEVQLGNFRSDLFFRLNIFPITIPPLRERLDDIPLLAAHFLEKHNKRSNKKVIGFSTTAIKELMAYGWPGNVRELEHLIERTILMTSQPVITHLHLPMTKAQGAVDGNFSGNFKTIDEVERDHIMAVLKSCRGKVGGTGGAAEVLKLPVTTVHSKMKRLGIGKKFHTEG
jgi:formate hydrogenlyase transcriptional activator